MMSASAVDMALPTDDVHDATKLRRLSRSGFISESSKIMPRLGVMVAHIQLFDQTTRAIEEKLAKQREAALAQKRPSDNQSKPNRRGRPKLGPRSDSVVFTPSNKEEPSWIKDLTTRPREDCIYITEIEQVEEVDKEISKLNFG